MNLTHSNETLFQVQGLNYTVSLNPPTKDRKSIDKFGYKLDLENTTQKMMTNDPNFTKSHNHSSDIEEKCFSYPLVRTLMFIIISLEFVKIFLGFLRFLRKNIEKISNKGTVIDQNESTKADSNPNKKSTNGSATIQVFI